ncbi:MAG: response regulator [Armatimonadetes bacterium]|nr:response regulator [Armatimonadota bacterium]
MSQIRVVIADDESIIRMDLKSLLEEMGFEVVGEAADGQKVVELTRTHKPDVVLLDIKMPVMDGLDAAKIISEEKIAPVVLLTAYSQKDLVQRAKDAGVYAYLVKPFQESDLMPAIEIAIARYLEQQEMETTLGDLEQKLETRKLVDKAKGILMDKYKMSEADAFRRIQQQSMNQRRSMREIAEAIVIAHEI